MSTLLWLSRHRGALALVAAALGLVASAAWSPWRLDVELREQADGKLASIAEHQSQAITQWRGRVLADAATLASTRDIERGLLPSERPWIAQVLETRGFRDAVRYAPDGSGAVVLGGEGRFPSDPTPRRELIRSCRESRRAVLGEPWTNVGSAGTRIDVAAPVWADASRSDSPSWILVLSLGAEEELFSMLQWPFSSATAESVLVRRDGNGIVFVNAPRHADALPGSLVRPMGEALPAATAVLGTRGLVSGVDYRGVAVRAYLHPISDSPWSLVAKIDTAEISSRAVTMAWPGGLSSASRCFWPPTASLPLAPADARPKHAVSPKPRSGGKRSHGTTSTWLAFPMTP